MSTQTIQTDDVGYVRDVQCNRSHSGNLRLYQDGGYVQCQGCGEFTPTSSVFARIAARDLAEYDGAGGLARRSSR